MQNGCVHTQVVHKTESPGFFSGYDHLLRSNHNISVKKLTRNDLLGGPVIVSLNFVPLSDF